MKRRRKVGSSTPHRPPSMGSHRCAHFPKPDYSSKGMNRSSVSSFGVPKNSVFRGGRLLAVKPAYSPWFVVPPSVGSLDSHCPGPPNSLLSVIPACLPLRTHGLNSPYEFTLQRVTDPHCHSEPQTCRPGGRRSQGFFLVIPAEARMLSYQDPL